MFKLIVIMIFDIIKHPYVPPFIWLFWDFFHKNVFFLSFILKDLMFLVGLVQTSHPGACYVSFSDSLRCFWIILFFVIIWQKSEYNRTFWVLFDINMILHFWWILYRSIICFIFFTIYVVFDDFLGFSCLEKYRKVSKIH